MAIKPPTKRVELSKNTWDILLIVWLKLMSLTGKYARWRNFGRKNHRSPWIFDVTLYRQQVSVYEEIIKQL